MNMLRHSFLHKAACGGAIPDRTVSGSSTHPIWTASRERACASRMRTQRVRCARRPGPSILTGQYPARLHLTDWIPGRKPWPTSRLVRPQFEQQLPAGAPTIAEVLLRKGYRSAAVGKWHLGGNGASPLDRGLDVNVAGNAAGSPPKYFGPLELPGLKLGDGEFLTERLAEEGARFIADNRSRAFFLYQAHFTLHMPLEARADAIAKYKARDIGDVAPIYCAMVESADSVRTCAEGGRRCRSARPYGGGVLLR